MNVTFTTGRLAKNPQVFEKNGKKRVYLIVASRRPRKDDQPDYIGYWVFGIRAENCAKFLVKGQRVEIKGHISTYIKDGKFGESRVADIVDYYEKPRSTGTVTTTRVAEPSEPEPIPGSVIAATDVPGEFMDELEMDSELLDNSPF